MAGFVYLLGNSAMPCFYKIGCTERSPRARAAELSRGSGIPQAFEVLLYIEVDDHQRVERLFHREMADFRATSDREFFRFGPAHMHWLWYAFRNYQQSFAFAVGQWDRFATRPSSPDDYVETWIYGDTYLALPDSPPLGSGGVKLVVA